MREGELVEVYIDYWIMVNTACFWKMNPNYFRPIIVIDRDHGYDLSPFLKLSWDVLSDGAFSKASSDDASIVTSFDLVSETPPDQPESSVVEQAETTDECLLICCPMVPGFSLKDKMWGKILLLLVAEGG
jgi:hypothetical protein